MILYKRVKSNYIIWYDLTFLQFKYQRMVLLRRGTWLFITNTELYDFFKTMNASIDSKFLVARQLPSKVLLTEMYQLEDEFPLQEKDFAIWTPQQGLVCIAESFLKRRSNFQGLPLKALTQSVSTLN